jgi:hypothetical protein
LPFLYDEEGRRIRQANARFIDNRAMKLDAQRRPVPAEDA